MVSGQSFGSSVVSLACITSMCSVQCFPGGHSLRSALGSFFYPHPSPPLFFHCWISVTGAWFHWCGGSWLEGTGLPAMGAQLCLGAGCAKVEAPRQPGHPPPLATQLLTCSISCGFSCRKLIKSKQWSSSTSSAPRRAECLHPIHLC